jgi:thiamine transport system permease protein
LDSTRSTSTASRKSILVLLWLIPALFLGLFFFYPLSAIFRLVGQITLSEGLASLDLTYILRPLVFTFWQAGLSTLLTLLLGLPAAYVLSRYSFRGKILVRILTTLPFILPTVVVAAGFNSLVGPNGWLNLLLMRLLHLSTPPIHILNTLTAILLAHIFYNTTIIIRVVGSALEQMDPRLEKAARVMGASPWKAFYEITLPLLRLPIISATLLVFLFDFTSFGVILLLGGPHLATLEVEIYIQALHMLNLSLAGLLSLIQLGCTLIVSIIYFRISRQSRITLSPRLFDEDKLTVKTWRQRLFVAATLLFLVVLVVTPLVAMTARSVSKLEANRGERGIIKTGLTLAYYQELFINRRSSLFYVPPIEAVRNSLLFASATMLISIIIGTLASYALSVKAHINQWLDPLIMLPLGTSAVTLGLGFIIAFSRPPFNLSTFPLLIPFAHSLVALPFVIRSLQPAILSIPDALRQAAAVQGATPWRIWLEIDLPILLRAILVAAIFAFTISLGEFGATTFLARPEYPTMPVAIFRFLSQPGALNYGQAMAMATILLIACGLSIGLLESLQKPGQKFL